MMGERTEILIHNMSHSDMILTVKDSSASDSGSPDYEALCRPKFSKYREVSEVLLDFIRKTSNMPESTKQELYERHPTPDEKGNFKLLEIPTYRKVPFGMNLSNMPCKVDSGTFMNFRGKDKQSNMATSGESTLVTAISFPLMSVLLSKWINHLTLVDRGSAKKMVIVISGRGTPNDPNGSLLENSTQAAAIIARDFFKRSYPELDIVTIHSTTNLFRYDENIIFVKKELLPLVDNVRNDMASKVGSRWKEFMGITLSFADGSTARVSAINQSLRHYRPSYMHFWQLKTFWMEGKVSEDDIELHSYEEISTEPAMSVGETSSKVQLLYSAMQEFRKDYEKVLESDPTIDTDLYSFWLRKTRKPVLAVLLVEKPGQKPKLYRGTNMEVSMPTGSLCAERNVIGSALADDITLRRQDLKMIAVYSARPLRSTEYQQPLSSNGNSANNANQLLCIPVHDSQSGSPSTTPKSPSGQSVRRKILGMVSEKESPFTCNKRSHSQLEIDVGIIKSNKKHVRKSFSFYTPHGSYSSGLDNLDSSEVISGASGTSESSGTSEVSGALEPIYDGRDHCCCATRTITVEEGDMNPLKPCGACTEWLKKIAEVNPEFSVVTFTDYNCGGVYCVNIESE